MKLKILAAFDRYSKQVDSLLNELQPISDELLNRKPADGGWSAIQTLHHLILVEQGALAYVHKKLSFNPKLEKAGFNAWGRSVLLSLSLYSPIKFKAPKSAGNERLPAWSTFAETELLWQNSRQEWQSFLAKMPEELADKAAFKHPRAGRLSWLQTFAFLRIHLERHRTQARRAVS